MIVKEVDSGLSEQLQEKTGMDAQVSVELKDGVMLYTFTLPTPVTMQPELGRFFVATNRLGTSQTEGIKLLLSIVDRAGYKIGCRYTGADMAALVMEPNEFLRLMTAPMAELGFNYSEILTQLIDNFNMASQEPEIQQKFTDYSAGVDGAYLTMKATARETAPMLSDESLDGKVRESLAAELYNGPYGYAVRCMAKAAQELKLRGVKYDISDPVGNQRVVTLEWDELERLARISQGSNGAELQLEMVDEFLTNDIAKQNMPIKFSHATEPPVLRLIITYDYPSAQFQSILTHTGEDAILTTYSSMLSELLPQMPEITEVRAELVNTGGIKKTYTFPRERFTSK